MARRKDPLLSEIERSLEPGSFISYGESWGFVNGLENTRDKIDGLVKQGDAARAVSLFETFMAGCYEKMEEIDDSDGSMGDFFEDLFCSWINARQKAKLSPEETVKQILKMVKSDDYGLCCDIEKKIAHILNKKELSIFENIISNRVEDALSSKKPKPDQTTNKFSYHVQYDADILKNIYISRNDLNSYFTLCDKTGMTPKDCEAIAKIYMLKKEWKEALSFVNKGLTLEKEKKWHNQSSYGLSGLKRELLSKLGYKGEALLTAWTDFKKYPSEYSYKELMKYTPKKDKKQWHDKAIIEAKEKSLPEFIELCTITKEWDILAEHILNVKHQDLESIGHYKTEKSAKKLSKTHPAASAKLYRALGIRILISKKSKYYHYALDHFEKAKNLYQKSRLQEEWTSVVKTVRENHSRKYSFIGDFEELVKGHISKPPSFLEKTQKQWRKRIS